MVKVISKIADERKRLNEMGMLELERLFKIAHGYGVQKAEREQEKWGDRMDACGFGWVNLHVNGNTKLGRKLKAIANAPRGTYPYQFNKSHTAGVWSFWSVMPTQAITINEMYASGVAEYLQEAGFKAFWGSRMD